MNRPVGVTILAIITFFAGLMGLCYAMILLITSGFADFGVGEELFGIDARAAFFVSALLAMVGPILYLLFSYGALDMKKWAWWLGVLATGLGIVGGLIHVLNGGEFAPTVARGVLDIVIFVYLLTPHVRKAFRLGGSAPAVQVTTGGTA
jgi:hypothetical protein